MGEIVRSKFERAYQMEMYLKTVTRFEGDGDFFSKFGYEIRDETRIVVPRRAFERYIPSSVAKRPREGDILYVPVMKRFFEIKKVQEEETFYSLGKRSPHWYELNCEMLRYNQEEINTGNDEVDDYEATIAQTIQLQLSGFGANNFNIGEMAYQGSSLVSSTARGRITDWIRANGTIKLINVIGEFGAGNVTGATTNTRGSLTNVDVLGDYEENNSYDNKEFEIESNTIVIVTESNPIGNP
jgi:hypothetical protein